MQRLFSLLLIAFFGISLLSAQPRHPQQAFKDLCGCFDVSFSYATTFTNDTTRPYSIHPRSHTTVEEAVIPLIETPEHIVLQHILIVPSGGIIKHWREDWTYQYNVLWEYVGDNTWQKRILPDSLVKGKWHQSVWEVNDAPRYQGVSKWVATNGQYFWLNTAFSPLPRREYTKRHDYNILERTNKIIVDKDEWIHEQDNKKIIRNYDKDSVLAEEKGYNIYRRAKNSVTCLKKVQDFWTPARAQYWTLVRQAWDHLLQNAHQLTLLPNNQQGTMQLANALDAMEKKSFSENITQKDIENTLQKYLRLQ